MCVVGKPGECYFFKTEQSAKAFARIGSQKGRARTVARCGKKSCKRIRKYVRGKKAS